MRSTLRKSIVPQEQTEQPASYQPKHIRRLEVVDDFIRNFLRKNNMTKTLNSFQVFLPLSRKNGTNTQKDRKKYPMPKLKMKCWKIRSSNSTIAFQKLWFYRKEQKQLTISCWRKEIFIRCIIKECRKRRRNWTRISRDCMHCRASMRGNTSN